MNDAKLKSLQLAMANLDKQFGKNAVIYGNVLPDDCEVVSTNNFKLDLALGVMGLPKGRIIEIYGPEAMGKSLIATGVVAAAQAIGQTALYIDAECDADSTWMIKNGVDMDALLLAQPEYGEAALEIAIKMAQSGAVDVIVIDSVAALVPKAELEGSMEDNFMGLQARMMGQALRKIRQIASETNTMIIFINQVRDKIGPMPGTTTPGGRALKFFASVRIELRLVKQLTNSAGESVGNRVKALVKKNKVAAPMKAVEYDILHGVGFVNSRSIVELAERFGFILKSGSWYSRVDMETGEKSEKAFAQGVENAGEALEADPAWMQELKDRIQQRVFGGEKIG